MKTFGGQVLFLDRADINTDEIIPAKYLTEITQGGPQALSARGPEAGRVRPAAETSPATTGRRQPARTSAAAPPASTPPGPSRSTASRLVIAESFARIFRQNMFNCGLLAVELPTDTIARLFRE